jgi:chromosome partitioning protein
VSNRDVELVGISEIAQMGRVSRAAVTNWRSRHADFPPPVAELQAGPVFERDQVKQWLKRRRIEVSATVISTINLKGGVGKSTTTVAVGEFLAAEFGKRVLIIDLDPQTNATTMLIGEDKWKDLNDAEHTLARLFKDALADKGDRTFDLEKTLQRRVSNVSDVRRLDLLPSSLDLITVQDRLGTMSTGAFFSDSPTDILRRAVRPILDEYDYVLIDCPPNLGLITLNGLRISSGYVIPTIPDVLSTYGIPQIMSRVQEFADNVGAEIEPLGIIISKFRAQATVHRNVHRRLLDDEDLPIVFETVIPESNDISQSAEHRPVGTLRQKYGYGGNFNLYRALTEEIVEAAG